VPDESRRKESESFTLMALGNPSTLPLGFHLCFRALPHKVRVWEATHVTKSRVPCKDIWIIAGSTCCPKATYV
jgi:hypothetical protein